VELTRISQCLDTFVRPATSPVAIKMIGSAEEIPERAKMPKRDLGATMPLCQGLALSRRHGMIIAMGKEDMLCPVGAVALGLLPAKPKFLDGTFGIPFWVPTQEMTAKLARGMARLEAGRYTHVVAAPIERAAFEPDVIVVYGNPAQIARLIQATVYVTGEPVISRSAGGFACAEQIARTMLTGQCQYVIAGGGDRVIAQAQDDEASFALPISQADALAEGLEEGHKRGVRYPTRSYLTFGAVMPKSFGQMMEYLEGDEE